MSHHSTKVSSLSLLPLSVELSRRREKKGFSAIVDLRFFFFDSAMKRTCIFDQVRCTQDYSMLLSSSQIFGYLSKASCSEATKYVTSNLILIWQSRHQQVDEGAVLLGYIVANCPENGGTVPNITSLSRYCPEIYKAKP